MAACPEGAGPDRLEERTLLVPVREAAKNPSVVQPVAWLSCQRGGPAHATARVNKVGKMSFLVCILTFMSLMYKLQLLSLKRNETIFITKTNRLILYRERIEF